MTYGHVAAAPVDLLISTSPDQKFEVVLIGDRTGDDEPVYHRMAIRNSKDQKELPLPEDSNMDGAYNLRSLEAMWSPDSSMVALSVEMYKRGGMADAVLRWQDGAWIRISMPEGAVSEGWLPPNKLICTTRKESLLKLNGNQTAFQSQGAGGTNGNLKVAP